MVRLQPISEHLECDILQKLIGVLTHKTTDSMQATSVSCNDLRASTTSFSDLKAEERFAIFRFVVF